MLRAEETPKATPCVRCRGPAPEGWEVWAHRLCASCCAAWREAPNFDVGDVEPSVPLVLVGEARHQAECAEWTRRTAAWVRGGA